jgi:hypothetical protein
MQNHLTVIDADAHVIETEHTWDYVKSRHGFHHAVNFRSFAVRSATGTVQFSRQTLAWLAE